MVEYDKGHRINPETQTTVSEFLALWLVDKQSALEPSTFRSYKITVDRVVPHIGGLKLRDVNKSHLLSMLRELRKPGANRRDKTMGLGEATLNRTVVILAGAFDAAIKDGYLSRNPCSDVERPKKKKPIPFSWTKEELKSLLAAGRDDRLYPLWHLTANTGLRRSEALGLRWDSVNLDEGWLLVVERNVMVGADMIHRPGTKSDSGRRTIDLDPETVAVLKRWRETQEFEAMLVEGYNPERLVFTAESGKGLHGDRIGDAFGALMKKAGVRRNSFKGLWSTHCTLLLRDGNPVKDVSERMGHSTAAFTITNYQASIPAAQSGLAQRFASLLD